MQAYSPTHDLAAVETEPIQLDSVRDLWAYRELLYFFAWRDIKVRYRQAALGMAWAVIQPLFNMALFTVIFGRLAHVPSYGVPYPLFSYCALVPWTYFAGVVGLGSHCLTNNSSLITKVYFPRVLLPSGIALAGLLDFFIASILLVGMMIHYHIAPSWNLLLLPLVLLLMVMLTVGLTMLVAALNVRYRDIKYVLPFVIQLWMFATPVIYPFTMFPAKYRPFLALNPCWVMVDGFRACLLPNIPVDFKLIWLSIGAIFVIFGFGVYYFHRMEKTFADII